VFPYTVGNYLATAGVSKVDAKHAAFGDVERETRDRLARLLGASGKRTAVSFHRELGKIVWDRCGMGRTRDGLREALAQIPVLREQFWRDVKVVGSAEDVNQALETANRVADFFELAEVMCQDALEREESCGGHFREEYQTEDGEAKRDDERFTHVAVWEWRGAQEAPARHIEPLTFEHVKPAQRSYK